MTRRELREHGFKMLFSADFYPAEEAPAQIELYYGSPVEDETTPEGGNEILHKAEFDLHDSEYLREKIGNVMSKIPELDEKINGVTEGWTTKRMGKVELTILRLALYEMLYDDEVPGKVAINEAVELAKKFGGDDSPAFINGILAKLV